MIGLSGNSNTCKNPEVETLLKRLVACVEKFSYYPVKSSGLKAVQELMEKLCQMYELVRRNDTRFLTVANEY